MHSENNLDADLSGEGHPHRTATRSLSCGDCVVSHCTGCACFGFEYGGIHLTLDRDGFAHLVRVVQRLDRLATTGAQGRSHKHYLPLPGINVQLVFRQDELPMINALLTRSHAWLRETTSTSLTTAVH